MAAVSNTNAAIVLRRLGGAAWRIAAFLAGLFLAFVTYIGLIFGACFEGGGLCSGDFDDTNREAFYTAMTTAVLVGPLLVVPFTRKWRWLAGAAALTLGLTVALAIALWP